MAYLRIDDIRVENMFVGEESFPVPGGGDEPGGDEPGSDDEPPTETRVTYLANSGLGPWSGNIEGELVGNLIPDRLMAETVVLGDGVTSIGESAFAGCSNLTSISIPSGVQSVGAGAFTGCSSLSNIQIDQSREYVQNNMAVDQWGLEDGAAIQCEDGAVVIEDTPQDSGDSDDSCDEDDVPPIPIPEELQEKWSSVDAILNNPDIVAAFAAIDQQHPVGAVPDVFVLPEYVQSPEHGNYLTEDMIGDFCETYEIPGAEGLDEYIEDGPIEPSTSTTDYIEQGGN